MSTDSQIIERSLDDPSAFADLFERHARVIGGFAARRVGHDAAEDVLSETFLVAFRRRKDFDPAWESAKPWLLGIASRLVKKHHAQEAKQWRAFAASASGSEPWTDGQIGASDGRADAASALRALAPRIAGLSSRDRDTLLLYAWGELTYAQIAVAQGIPVGTVRSRLNRVRRKLARTGSSHGSDGTRTEEEEANGRLGSRA